tara:strand:+ start:237 stop:509 length:273 start_codon:yes stop_codon:yes gene_type:complete
MSLKVTGGRDFPTRINLSGLKNVDKADVKALSAIMLAKAASQGSLEDVAALWAGVNSNANITEDLATMNRQIAQMSQIMAGLVGGVDEEE